MKVTIEYNLPDENYEYEIAFNARKYYTAINEVKDYIRTKLKWSELTPNEEVLLSEIREFVSEFEIL